MSNLIAWSLQALALIAVGALAARWLPKPKARLAFWQLLVLAVLVLPFVQPQRVPIYALEPDRQLVAELVPVVPVPEDMDPVPTIPLNIWTFLAAGVALRLLWLGWGMAKLAILRKRAQRLAEPPVFWPGTKAAWFVSKDVSGPVTFGLFRPSVLLPEHVLKLPEAQREAIAYHELLHVERGDWTHVIAEELVRSLLWFHPAVWYALAQVQLAREQAVDEEVVRATRDRTGYLDALVAVAERKMVADVAPAPLFLKKRQLAVRVAAMLKEDPMSKSRIAARIAAAATAAFASAVIAVWLFPLESQAQQLPDDPGISVNAGAPLLHRPPVSRLAAGIDANGTMVLDATVARDGEVTDVRVVSGPEELRKLSITSVFEWHYATSPPPPTSVRVTIDFAEAPAEAREARGFVPPPPPPPPPPPYFGPIPLAEGGRGGARGGPTAFPPPPPPPPPPGPETKIAVDRITYVALGPELERLAREKVTFNVGDIITGADWLKVRDNLKALDEHLSLRLSGNPAADGGMMNGTFTVSLSPMRLPTPQSPAPQVLTPPAGAVRVAPGVQARNIETQARPVYPPIARQARVQGAVIFEVVIGPDGALSQIGLVSGHPMLARAAEEAVRQWRWKPTLMNGQPVPVITTVEVNFTLL